MAPGTRRANRGTYAAEHDDFEGLPIRQWREEWITVAAPPAVEMAPKNDLWASELPHGMPKDLHLLPPHSQELLRATRSGLLYKRPLSEDDEADGEVPTHDKSDKKEDDDEAATGARGFTVRTWRQVVRSSEGPAVSHLAKRRKGTVTLPSRYAVIQPAGPTVTRATVRRIDAAGNPYTQEVTLTEGEPVDGEIISTSVVVVPQVPQPGGGRAAEAAVTHVTTPSSSRRKPPPPKRKGRGPGRGRKKKLLLPESSVMSSQPDPAGAGPAPSGVTADIIKDGGVVMLVPQAGKLGDDTPTRNESADNDDDEEGDDEADEGDDDADEGEVDEGEDTQLSISYLADSYQDQDDQEDKAQYKYQYQDEDQNQYQDQYQDRAQSQDRDQDQDYEMADAAPIQNPVLPIPLSSQRTAADREPARRLLQPTAGAQINLAGPPLLSSASFHLSEGSPLKNVVLPSPTGPSPHTSPAKPSAPSFFPPEMGMDVDMTDARIGNVDQDEDEDLDEGEDDEGEPAEAGEELGFAPTTAAPDGQPTKEESEPLEPPVSEPSASRDEHPTRSEQQHVEVPPLSTEEINSSPLVTEQQTGKKHRSQPKSEDETPASASITDPKLEVPQPEQDRHGSVSLAEAEEDTAVLPVPGPESTSAGMSMLVGHDIKLENPLSPSAEPRHGLGSETPAAPVSEVATPAPVPVFGLSPMQGSAPDAATTPESHLELARPTEFEPGSEPAALVLTPEPEPMPAPASAMPSSASRSAPAQREPAPVAESGPAPAAVEPKPGPASEWAPPTMFEPELDPMDLATEIAAQFEPEPELGSDSRPDFELDTPPVILPHSGPEPLLAPDRDLEMELELAREMEMEMEMEMELAWESGPDPELIRSLAPMPSSAETPELEDAPVAPECAPESELDLAVPEPEPEPAPASMHELEAGPGAEPMPDQPAAPERAALSPLPQPKAEHDPEPVSMAESRNVPGLGIESLARTRTEPKPGQESMPDLDFAPESTPQVRPEPETSSGPHLGITSDSGHMSQPASSSLQLEDQSTTSPAPAPALELESAPAGPQQAGNHQEESRTTPAGLSMSPSLLGVSSSNATYSMAAVPSPLDPASPEPDTRATVAAAAEPDPVALKPAPRSTMAEDQDPASPRPGPTAAGDTPPKATNPEPAAVESPSTLPGLYGISGGDLVHARDVIDTEMTAELLAEAGPPVEEPPKAEPSPVTTHGRLPFTEQQHTAGPGEAVRGAENLPTNEGIIAVQEVPVDKSGEILMGQGHDQTGAEVVMAEAHDQTGNEAVVTGDPHDQAGVDEIVMEEAPHLVEDATMSEAHDQAEVDDVVMAEAPHHPAQEEVVKGEPQGQAEMDQVVVGQAARSLADEEVDVGKEPLQHDEEAAETG